MKRSNAKLTKLYTLRKSLQKQLNKVDDLIEKEIDKSRKILGYRISWIDGNYRSGFEDFRVDYYGSTRAAKSEAMDFKKQHLYDGHASFNTIYSSPKENS